MEHSKEFYAFINYKREDKKEAMRLLHALEHKVEIRTGTKHY